MRNLDECQAEVFRRSEKRKKERKRNRNRIMTLCIPLFLVLAVWSVAILLPMFPINNRNLAAHGNPEAVGGMGGYSADYISVSVAGTGDASQTTILVEDVNIAAQIYYSIDSAFVYAGEEDDKLSAGNGTTDDGAEDQSNNFSQSESTNVASGYTITFTTGTGTQLAYTLNGNVLTDNATKKRVTLTDTQRSQILDKLGLVITWEEEPK